MLHDWALCILGAAREPKNSRQIVVVVDSTPDSSQYKLEHVLRSGSNAQAIDRHRHHCRPWHRPVNYAKTYVDHAPF